MLFLELVVQGLIQGSTYAIIAVGLTLVYGLLRVLHVAHAGLFTLGAYLGVLVTNHTGSLGIGVTVAATGAALAGILIYRLVYEPILDRPPYVALIASIGLYMGMEELFRLVFGPFGMSFVTPPLQDVVQVAGIYLRTCQIATVVINLVLLGILAWVAQGTKVGTGWRATVDDPKMAACFGIDPIRVRYLVFGMGSALAAVAGVLVALLSNLVEPTMGAVPSYKSLAIIVLGGLGNVGGTLIASLVLGVVEAFGTIYLGSLLDRDAIAFAFLIIVLMIRPTGLFTSR
ncbi:branched-chain amino acid ABC transporter permease [Desulfosarcina ovata]|uniref:Branched-chain amino acid ABC transporter permease n=2 Tax=Desulfosarcina ovata TaxID=83564 RepID=A0A5K8AES6_9BACT|nr:branched-chain amino acid ABC transporter permease [Desulfosarcina ovata]BBO83962.1 branched-chain amino acid ABC transporter permease [Desulfosarcina ovata subsp. sediminis]BBO90440.1 branched-chain amino acid ABC transporter permease [Desulfosarcina ovata subsp. ovata]